MLKNCFIVYFIIIFIMLHVTQQPYNCGSTQMIKLKAKLNKTTAARVSKSKWKVTGLSGRFFSKTLFVVKVLLLPSSSKNYEIIYDSGGEGELQNLWEVNKELYPIRATKGRYLLKGKIKKLLKEANQWTDERQH